MLHLSHFHALRICGFLALVGGAALPANADPPLPRDLQPSASDLRDHVVCSLEAERRLLSLDEAAACARAYMRVKLAFVPGMELDEFDKLPAQERAAVNLMAYARYVEWLSANSAEIAALKDALAPNSAFASK